MTIEATVRAAVLHDVGDLRIEDQQTPTPGPGEVLIRVAVCGVCGSDATEFGHHLALAKPPVALGHEFAGVVEAVGPGVTAPPVGATVVSGAGISCGECKPCRQGRTNLCRSYSTIGFHHDGGLSGYVVSPASITLDVSDSGLALDTLGLTQPMAIAVHAVRRSGLSQGDDAVVIGVGGIGAFITVAAAATGARVLVVDLNDDRLELARRLGAAETLKAGTTSLSDRLDELGMDADVFFEVSGSAPGLASVLETAKPGATIVPVGIQRGEPALPLGKWTLSEYTIIGTVAHVFSTDFPEAVRLLGTRDDWSDIASEVIPLDRVAEDALQPLLEGRSTQIKTLVDPWATDARPAVHTKS
ncbi:alcohol dehydrogenase catalytic domain-containing protein [Herbiconiux sp. KACC 21604]|uniref:zinc-dependent alcohol dehydrogenase n=1 Tax=unclassified Herbiconiux TaxID=2618217 RepID=UPI001491B0FD|nr:alcohol dehydrogenase catalytic domain-containing protein [Herbiconiux sp. SALV-R1]QJU54123.1 alcohol dehydrogenase catalytic domain-containing protein [Herbiconiux sp. SALV-R1]WPO85174.1 alcohol dehydrogenase catalytic domain-containing protein [Herbiconiux sp. KACC 21604]